MQLGDLNAASGAYQKAVDITNPLISVENEDVPAFYPAADAYAGLGNTFAIKARRATGAESARLWSEARSSYEKSLSLWRRIPNPSRISPTGFIAGDAREVTRRLNGIIQEKSRLASVGK
jgi:tetratricopeptide (TPR) repeat protein